VRRRGGGLEGPPFRVGIGPSEGLIRHCIFHCMYRPMAGTRVIVLYKLLLNLLTPISGLTHFASNAKRFYRELRQRIITNDDVIRRQ